jgi:Fe2+ transport system protein FeoA
MFGFRFRHRRCNPHHPEPAVKMLDEGFEESAYHIVANPDRQSREMGFFPGMEVRILRNVEGEHGLVVAVGSARYVLARKAAQAIRVAGGGGQ